MWAAWQLSVLAMGLMCLDHCHPGLNVARPTGPPSMFTSSSLPMPSSKGRVSSGEPKFLRTIPDMIATPQVDEERLAATLPGSCFRDQTSRASEDDKVANVLCVLYDDPVDGFPTSYPRDDLPRLSGYPDGQTLPNPTTIDFNPGEL